MEDFFLYLIKSSGILTLFWCCYKLFLEKETFFEWHRIFLISGMLIALIFPLWSLTKIVLVDPLPYTLAEISPSEPQILPHATINWWTVVSGIYGLGVVFFLGRLGIQLLSLKRLITKGTIIKTNGLTFIETKKDTSPFSFFNVIVYNPEMHSGDELKTIIAHEKIHCLQRHSIDILFIHLFSAFQWANPFVWLYKKTLSQNLEFIADQGTTKEMASSKEYQYLLLKNAAFGPPHSSIINPFFTSSIKKRIVMLNKNRSNKATAWKFSLVVPFLALFLVAFNTKTVTQVKSGTDQEHSGWESVDKDITKIIFTVYKTSTAKDLEQISSRLKKDYKVELTFTDLSRNAEGLLTAINSSFKSDHGSGTSSSSDKDGIQPFNLSMEIDEEGDMISIGYEMGAKEQGGDEKANKPATDGGNSTATDPIFVVEGEADPLYIVDGIEVVADFKATDIDPSEIHSVNVLKGVAATNKYGDKGKAGVIEIITKRFHKTQTPLTIIEKDQTVSTYEATINVPLYIVDGEEKEAGFNSNDIPVDSIESIRVTKGEEAIEKFGEKGKHGVVEITTKNNKWKVGYGIETNAPTDILNLSSFKKNGMENAVVFLDGVNKGKNYSPTIKYSEVESIATSLPSPQTSKEYGKSGKHGVIKITTRKD